MKRLNVKSLALSTAFIVILIWAAGLGIVRAQQPPTASPVKRNILLKQDLTIPGREGVMVTVELPPGVAEGRHTHPAELFVFVQEGAVTLENEGQADKSLKAGDVFYIAPGKIHQVINHGTVTAKLAATFITEKGKPLATPAK
ncbi:MAG TPA: cupin domain-containing protein [Roseimicrobium sp.]|nr:cupin domain-containing protein [Roseimicrobium sp.]